MKVSGATFLIADVSWVLVRRVRAEVLRKEDVVVSTAPSESNAWAARCLDSSTQLHQRSQQHREVRPLVHLCRS